MKRLPWFGRPSEDELVRYLAAHLAGYKRVGGGSNYREQWLREDGRGAVTVDDGQVIVTAWDHSGRPLSRRVFTDIRRSTVAELHTHLDEVERYADGNSPTAHSSSLDVHGGSMNPYALDDALAEDGISLYDDRPWDVQAEEARAKREAARGETDPG